VFSSAPLPAATVEGDASPLAFLCRSLTNVTRFTRSGSRIYCQRKQFPFVCPLLVRLEFLNPDLRTELSFTDGWLSCWRYLSV